MSKVLEKVCFLCLAMAPGKDGVDGNLHTTQDIVDDPRTWSDGISEEEASEVESATDSLLNGTDGVGARFLQGEGPVLQGVFSEFSVAVPENPRLSPLMDTLRNE